MKRPLLLLVLFLQLSTGWCQTAPSWEWADQAWGNQITPGKLIVNADGTIYQSLGYQGSVDFLGRAEQKNYVDLDAIFYRITSKGKFVWSKWAEGMIKTDDDTYGICSDANSNAYFSLNIGQVKIDGTIYSWSNGGGLLYSYTKGGAFRWLKQINASIYSVQMKGTDQILISGRFYQSTFTFANVTLNATDGNTFLAAYSLTGTELWIQGKMGTTLFDVTVAPDSTINAWGWLSDRDTIIMQGDTSLPSKNVYAYGYFHLDKQGKLLSKLRIDSPDPSTILVKGFAADQQNNIFMMLEFHDNLSVGDTLITAQGGTPFCGSTAILKISPQGKLIKAFVVNCHVAGGLAIGRDNRMYITGTAKNSVKWSNTYTMSNSGDFIYLLKTDDDLNPLWNLTARNTTSDFADEKVTVGNDNSIYVYGRYWGGPVLFGGDSAYNTSGSAMYIAKVTNDFMLSTPGAKVQEKFTIYPNPSSSVLNITPLPQTDFSYTVFNLPGQVVSNGKRDPLELNNIDISELPPGIYILKLEINGERHVQKFVKQ